MRRIGDTSADLLVVVLAALLVHGVVLGHGFIYDDVKQILENVWLTDPGYLREIFSSHVWAFDPDYPLTSYYRPLMHTANLLVYTLFGPNPAMFHLLSLLLHLACCCLFYLLCRELLARLAPKAVESHRTWPFWATLVFAVNPIVVEGVAWLGSSGDLLYSLFALMAAYCYLRSGTRFGLPLLLTAVAFAAALLSKETALLVVPALVVTIDLMAGPWTVRRFATLCTRKYPLLVAVGLGYLFLRLQVLGGLVPMKKYGLDGWPMVVSATQKLAWYFFHLLWPFRHNFYPELPSPFLLPTYQALLLLLFCGVVLAGLVWLARQDKVLIPALVLILVPLGGALQSYVLRVPVAERYLYLPAMGFCMVLAWLLLKLRLRSSARGILGGTLIVVLAASAFYRQLDFVDGVTLWRDTVHKSPKAMDVRVWYAENLFNAGMIEEGVAQAEQIEAMGSTDPGNFYQLVDGLLLLGRLDEADRYLAQRLSMTPDHVWGRLLLGRLLLARGRLAEALEQIEIADRLGADTGDVQLWLGKVYQRLGRDQQAAIAFGKARAALPKNAAARKLLPPAPAADGQNQGNGSAPGHP